AVSGIAFACVFGGAVLGMLLRPRLREHHLSQESKDLVKTGVGLIATMSALVLGLLVASAKASYDTQRDEVTQMAANVVVLDRVLAHYGPEAKEAREQLRNNIAGAIDQMWQADGSGTSQAQPPVSAEALYDMVQDLAPKNDAQRALQAQALKSVIDLG